MQTERQPLYMQIQDFFRQRIVSGLLKPNDRIPPEKELMEQFGVSRITVANALTQLAEEGWIYRIPGKGSFVKEGAGSGELAASGSVRLIPDELATAAEERDRQSGRRKMIGLILPMLEDHFALRLISGIDEILSARGYSLFVALSNNSIEIEKRLILECLEKGTAGLLIFPSDAETYNEEILALKLANYPFVLIDRTLPGIETNYVCADSMSGTKLAFHHLWSLGHRKIAICSDTPLPTITVSDRINGYMEAAKEHGALIDPALILTDFRVDYSDFNEQHPLHQFIQNQTATAFITLNARLGVYLSHAAKQVGLRVPEDVSVLTFDDPSSGYDEFGTYTHISQSEKKMGREAAAILLDQLESSPSHGHRPYSKIILLPELVVRNSTARWRGEKASQT
ncbi:GntR family transcriptional regulator [Gorillibacterium timonense]|uniref:GntR family transcriptional regulator n=1 Tax=Gorillibacterium timonense TaxID=1689269 RepID=UPI00071CD128|nr:GntR family transcriptional regulator [Gorillibacterium timonense]